MILSTEALIAQVPTRLLTGGQWRETNDRASFTVVNPATGEALAEVQNASPSDGLAALDAAVSAQASWAGTAPRVRGEILRRAWELLQQRREDFALLITLEMGKPLREARGEVSYGGEFLRWFAEEAVRITGRDGTNPEGTGTTIVSQRPVGPRLLITPWNFPLAMATRKVAPALAAGCTVVIKPAELTPLTTLLFGQLLIDAGVPPGVVNIVPTTSAAAVTGPLIDDPRLRKLSFTGSTAVGRQLLRQAADGIVRTSMELGGKAPFLVFDDADIDAAVGGAILAKFRNIGQACTAANRFLVHRGVLGKFTQALCEQVAKLQIGAGSDPRTDIGPLIDAGAVDHARAFVEDAVRGGGQVLVGGNALPGPGTFFEPTLVSNLAPDARLLHEEIFAPVLGIVTFDSEQEAIEMANATEYGLVSYAYTKDLGRARRLIDGLQTGMTGINTGIISNASAPFGGMKQSGIGRGGGAEGIHEYLETKYTLIAN